MTAERIAAGELDARVPETSKAEVGVLERAFNSMAESLQHHVGELARLSDEQAALRRVATLVARGGRPSDEVFAVVAEEMARCVRVMHATVSRYDAVRPSSPSRSITGDRLRKLPEDLRLPLEGDNVAARVCAPGRTARMDSHDDAPGCSTPHAYVSSVSVRRWESRSSSTGACGARPSWARRHLSRCRRTPRRASATLSRYVIATAIANAATRAELDRLTRAHRRGR